MVDSKHIITVEHVQSGVIYRQSSNNASDSLKWALLYADKYHLSEERSPWKVAIYTNWQLEHDKKLFKPLGNKELTEALKIT